MEKQIKIKNQNEAKNIAYQALFLADGVVFLLRKISHFTVGEVEVRADEKGVYIGLGKNVAQITERIMDNLRKHKTIFLYHVPEGEYDPDTMPIAFEMKASAMEKLEILWQKTGEKKDATASSKH